MQEVQIWIGSFRSSMQHISPVLGMFTMVASIVLIIWMAACRIRLSVTRSNHSRLWLASWCQELVPRKKRTQIHSRNGSSQCVPPSGLTLAQTMQSVTTLETEPQLHKQRSVVKSQIG